MNKLAKSTAIIELHVPSFEIVKNFYKDLGFKVLWEYPVKKQEGYLTMSLEDNLICFFCGNEEVYNHPYFKKFDKRTPRGYGVELSIFIKQDINMVYDKFRKLHKTNIVEELKIKPWGIKDFRFIDPFGYYIRISEPSDMSKP